MQLLRILYLILDFLETDNSLVLMKSILVYVSLNVQEVSIDLNL